MIRRVVIPIVILAFVVASAAQQRRHPRNGQESETRSIDGLHLCALILNEFYDKDENERIIDVLMAPGDVSEGNLYVLFEVLSKRFPNDSSLKVWVNTDVEQLASLATGIGGSGSPRRERILQLALYKRTKSVELFQYNPNYPKAGEKTVVIRGKSE